MRFISTWVAWFIPENNVSQTLKTDRSNNILGEIVVIVLVLVERTEGFQCLALPEVKRRKEVRKKIEKENSDCTARIVVSDCFWLCHNYACRQF
jgi:hypothetical protein